MKFISKKYWQGMENSVEQISIKFWGFYIIKRNLLQTVMVKHAHQNISKNIGENSHVKERRGR